MTGGPIWYRNVERWFGEDRPAVVESGRTTTWRSLADMTERATHLLDINGVEAGTSVPALVESSAEAFALTLAGSATRRPIAPLGTRLLADELIPLVRSLSTTVIVADTAFASLAETIARAVGATVVELELGQCAPTPIDVDVEPTAPAFVLHTSGTTGAPKRVVWTHERMARRASAWSILACLGSGSSLVCASPFQHLAGIANFAVALDVGAASIPIKRFTVEAFIEACSHQPSHALLVPSMIEMLLDHGAFPVPSLRFLQYGASPIRPATMRRIADLMPDTDIANIFGQTEGAPLTCLTPEDHRRAASGADHLLGSVGRPVPGLDLRIDDPDDDGIGEVVVRADHLAAPDETGWLHTGDLGRVDDDGYLYLVSRKNDRIVRGGENIYPAEVEIALDAQPGVKESAVVGAPDDRLGERVVAFVVPDDPANPPDPSVMRAAVASSLSSFKVPAEIRLVAELPRNPAGKVLRTALVARLVAS